MCKGQITKSIGKVEQQKTDAKKYLDDTDQTFTTKDERLMARIAGRLKNSWENIRKYLESWKKAQDFDQNEYDQYLDEKHVFDVLDEIIDIRSDLEIEMERIPHPTNESASETSATSVQASQTVQPKLRPFELPKFNGNPIDWPSFFDLFNAMVGTQQIADVQKLCYLREALIGSARDVIDGLKSTDGNYKIALDLLKDRYDKGEDIRTMLLNQLDQLNPSTNASNTRILLDRLNIIIRQLKEVGITCDSQTDIHKIQKLLPPWLMEKIFHQVPKSTDRTCDKILKTANEIISQRESLELLYDPSVSCKAKDEVSDKTSMNFDHQKLESDAKEVKRKPQEPCAFCTKHHWNSECTEFADKEARTNCARKLNLCFKCLSGKHLSNDCQSKVKCSECSHAHHKLLSCSTFLKKSVDRRVGPSYFNSNTIPLGDKNVCATTIAEDAIDWIPLHSNIGISAKVSQPLTKAVTFLDTGSAVNLITKEFAERLGLNFKKSNISLRGVNSQRINSEVFETTAYLHCVDGNLLPIKLLVLESIVGPTTIIHNFPNTINEAQNWKLESVVQQPELLIGLMTYHDIRVVSPGTQLGNGFLLFESDIGIWLCTDPRQKIPSKATVGICIENSSSINSLIVSTENPCQKVSSNQEKGQLKNKRQRVRIFYNSKFYPKNHHDSRRASIIKETQQVKDLSNFRSNSSLSRPAGSTCRVFHRSTNDKCKTGNQPMASVLVNSHLSCKDGKWVPQPNSSCNLNKSGQSLNWDSHQPLKTSIATQHHSVTDSPPQLIKRLRTIWTPSPKPHLKSTQTMPSETHLNSLWTPCPKDRFTLPRNLNPIDPLALQRTPYPVDYFGPTRSKTGPGHSTRLLEESQAKSSSNSFL